MDINSVTIKLAAKCEETARWFEAHVKAVQERKHLAKCADWSHIAEREWKSDFPYL